MQQFKSREKAFRGDMQDTVLDGLSRLRIDALVPDTTMTSLKGVVRTWLDAAVHELERRISPNYKQDLSAESTPSLRSTIAEGFKVKGRTRVDSCYDLPLSETIGRLLRHGPRTWKQMCRSQQECRTHDHSSPDFVIADITDGSVFIDHPQLGKAMIGRDPGSYEPIRLAVGLNRRGGAVYSLTIIRLQ
eukprot:4866146-Pleurochrysis_carterae.AAC.1